MRTTTWRATITAELDSDGVDHEEVRKEIERRLRATRLRIQWGSPSVVSGSFDSNLLPRKGDTIELFVLAGHPLLGSEEVQ